ncbi:M15 family metallopeptidase [Nocardioides caricicola]|uniref:M15 family metallopeptidase n=1 Tax=Nocardioides caricicola TaxID=634770 RepID=A0ABW0N3K8_9ACTN
MTVELPIPESQAQVNAGANANLEPPASTPGSEPAKRQPTAAAAAISRRPQPASRSGSRTSDEESAPDWLAECTSNWETQSYANGQLPAAELCQLPDGIGQLEPAAAAAWWELDRRFRERFDEPVCVTDSYRSLSQQQALRAAKPGLAAVPGTSNHGWATALDLCGGIESFDSAEHIWLTQNAPRLGWANPSWAQRYGSKPEPWHWEFAQQ